MSLIQQVAALVEERGEATVDDLMPDLEGVTRQQAMKALQNAAQTSLIVCDGRGPRAKCKGLGSLPGTYRAKPQPQRERVSSVWDFARVSGSCPVRSQSEAQRVRRPSQSE